MAACVQCGKYASCSCQLAEGKYCSEKCKDTYLKEQSQNKQKEKDVKPDNKGV